MIETEDDYKKQIAALNAELKQLKQQERDYEILKKQVAQQAAEYDRLADERNALERAAGNQTNELKKDVWIKMGSKSKVCFLRYMNDMLQCEGRMEDNVAFFGDRFRRQLPQTRLGKFHLRHCLQIRLDRKWLG